jgi:hypothetical protein
MNEEPRYNRERLEELWDMSYKEILLAAAELGGNLREPRFVMQAKVAMETRRLIWMTFAMVVATFAMAIATFVASLC